MIIFVFFSITQEGVYIDTINDRGKITKRFLNFDHIVANFKNDRLTSFVGKFSEKNPEFFNGCNLD